MISYTLIGSELSTKVYDGDACHVISNVRTVLDLQQLSRILLERGTVVVLNTSWEKFFSACKELDASLDARIDKRDFKRLKTSYGGWKKLQEMTGTES